MIEPHLSEEKNEHMNLIRGVYKDNELESKFKHKK